MAKKKKPNWTDETKIGCNCIEQINEQLKDHNCAITQEMQIDFKTGVGSMSVPSIRVHKIDSGKRKPGLPVVFCSYCPCCGRKYREDE